jgi:hypothetical protein
MVVVTAEAPAFISRSAGSAIAIGVITSLQQSTVGLVRLAVNEKLLVSVDAVLESAGSD